MTEPSSQTSPRKDFWRKNWGNVAMLVFATIGLVWMFKFVASMGDSVSPRETALATFILTLAGITASWFFSKLYAELNQDDSTQRLGTQVARGVLVLSDQIDMLVQWVANEKARQAT